MASSNALIPIDSLPPEVLQSLWRHLSLFDLLKCQRVYKKWLAYLPGDSSTLHQALFSPLARQSDTDTPCQPIWIEVTQHLEVSLTKLPRTRFNIDICNPEHRWTHGVFRFHPIIGDLFSFSDLIHPSFKPEAEHESFEFYTLDDLKVLARKVKSKRESWEHMLACIPKVQTMDIELTWQINWCSEAYDHTGSQFEYRVENSAGVTVPDVVKVVRRGLRETETELRSYCCAMNEIIGYCRE